MQVAQLKDSKNKNVASMYPEYMYHISDSVVYTLDRKMLATIAIQGIPFEFASDSFLENSFNGIKDYLVGVGKEGDVYLWTHFIKEKIYLDESYEFSSKFLNLFAEKYISLFKGG